MVVLGMRVWEKSGVVKLGSSVVLGEEVDVGMLGISIGAVVTVVISGVEGAR